MNNDLNNASRKSANEKYCKNCGNIISIQAEICPKCGVRQESPTSNSKNKLAAALLALFLGGFGIQFFYLGRNMAGLLSLLFCWTGIPAIIGFIQCILLLMSSDQEFNSKYN